MKPRRTTRGRVILAVLAGVLSAPVSFMLIMTAVTLVGKGGELGSHDLMLIGTMALIFGHPVAALTFLLFAPAWLWLHRRRAPFAAFVLAGSSIGVLVPASISLAGGFGPMSLVFGLAASASMALMWPVAYWDSDGPTSAGTSPG